MASVEENLPRSRTYVTFTYGYPYATINSLWATIRHGQYTPDHILLLATHPKAKLTKAIEAALTEIARAYNPDATVETQPITETDFPANLETLKTIIREHKQAGAMVAVDITPGRTLVKTAALGAALNQHADHIFYLSVDEYDYQPRPLPLQSQHRHQLMDLRGMLE